MYISSVSGVTSCHWQNERNIEADTNALQRLSTPLQYSRPTNLVPKVVSEPLFQSSPQKTTLVQGVIFYGDFDFIAMKFRMAVRVWFRLISTLFFILC